MAGAACALALVLLMDVSGSVTTENWNAQRDGTADAFRDAAIVRLITNQETIAVTAMAWGSDAHTVAPWTLIRSEADAARFASILAAARRPEQGQTNVANALSAAATALDAAPCTPDREVVDISGDGPSNAGNPAKARDTLAERGAVVNGLPIVTTMEPQLADYYRNQVVTPGGFVIPATGWGEFGDAIRRKLTFEVASR